MADLGFSEQETTANSERKRWQDQRQNMAEAIAELPNAAKDKHKLDKATSFSSLQMISTIFQDETLSI